MTINTANYFKNRIFFHYSLIISYMYTMHLDHMYPQIFSPAFSRNPNSPFLVLQISLTCFPPHSMWPLFMSGPLSPVGVACWNVDLNL